MGSKSALASMQALFTSVLVTLFLVTDSTRDCDVLISKWTIWSDPTPGLAAKLKVPVTESLSSWSVSFEFNKEFQSMDFFNSAKSDDEKGATFSVVNEAWSGKKNIGDSIEFAMLGYYQTEEEEPIQILYIALNNVLLCGALPSQVW